MTLNFKFKVEELKTIPVENDTKNTIADQRMVSYTDMSRISPSGNQTANQLGLV